jgi:hypothetical protein
MASPRALVGRKPEQERLADALEQTKLAQELYLSLLTV